MYINFEKYTLKVYSIDLICVQIGNDTKCSSFNINDCFNYLERNGIEGVKNRVEDVMLDFSDISIDSELKSLETKNYIVSKTTSNEFTTIDKTNRNNIRYIRKFQLFKKLYLLEINRLASTSLDELVADIKLLNNDFNKLIKG